VNALFGHMSLKEKFQVVLNQKGRFKCPNGVKALPKGLQVVAPPKGAAAPRASTDEFDMVVANLRQRGSSRPRTLKTLTSTIASILPKGLPQSEIAALVKRLETSRKVSVLNNKISYDL
jgi:hypothetical protein